MVELLCIISMALCKVLVLVNVGILEFFIYAEVSRGGLSRHVSRQIFLVLYRHCLRTKQGPEALPVRGGLLSEVFTMRRSTKQQWQVHPGDTFQPRGLTPSTPDPPDRQHFPSQALFAAVWRRFSTLKKPKHSKQESVREFHSFTPFNCRPIYTRRSPRKDLICAFASSCQYAIFLVLFLYMLFTLYCALRCEKYIGKNKDFYWLCI